MKMNEKTKRTGPGTVFTHGGGYGKLTTPEKELFRTVATCMLFEDTSYESGTDVAERIIDLCKKVSIKTICDIAKIARTDMKLRHAPLFLMCVALAKTGTPEERNMVGQTISEVILRADELAEIFAIYRKIGGKGTPRQLKAGVAKAFTKFNEYNLAKYNRDNEWKLRDALFLSHAKPLNEEQAELWQKLINGTLATPDTWEVELSAGKDKKKTFERLIKEEKLGYLALLRNLRNMTDAGVDKKIVEKALLDGAADSWALPYRFITAAKHAPAYENSLDKAMVVAAEQLPKLPGKTLLVVDISGSMQGALSGKSEMNRIDAACGLAILMREQAEDVTVYATAGNDGRGIHATGLVPARHGMSLRDAVIRMNDSLGGGGIFLKQCMDYIADHENEKFDRVIVFTDEQDCDNARNTAHTKKLGKFNYIVNVCGYEAGVPVKAKDWTTIPGFSERLVDWIMLEETLD